MLLRRILYCSLVVGVLAGLLATVIQRIEVVPLIHSAESLTATLEQPIPPHTPRAAPTDDMTLRSLQTLGTNIATAWGYALLLLSAMHAHDLLSAKPAVTVGSGLAWGLCGFLICFALPGLVISPQTPAYEHLLIGQGEPLRQRQLLWAGLSASTALGLALGYYGRKTGSRLLALLLLLLPPLLALALPPRETTLALRTIDQRLISHLEHNYAVDAALANGLFWLFLGLLCSAVTARQKLRERFKTPLPSA